MDISTQEDAQQLDLAPLLMFWENAILNTTRLVVDDARWPSRERARSRARLVCAAGTSGLESRSA